MRAPLTDSEQLFQSIAAQRGWRATPIPSTSTKRSPDYLVYTQNGGHFVAEIKELTANDDDVRFFGQLCLKNTSSYTYTFGARIHEKLNSASGQLREYAERRIPTAVIVYDNIVINGQRVHFPYGCVHLTDTDIDAGMFGEIATPVFKTPEGLEWGDTAHTINKSIQWSTQKGHHISAVAVVIPGANPNQAGSFRVFHNLYAKIKLPSDIFTASCDTQWFKQSDDKRLKPGWHPAPTA